jgi:hypothetical protein
MRYSQIKVVLLSFCEEDGCRARPLSVWTFRAHRLFSSAFWRPIGAKSVEEAVCLSRSRCQLTLGLCSMLGTDIAR